MTTFGFNKIPIPGQDSVLPYGWLDNGRFRPSFQPSNLTMGSFVISYWCIKLD
ncbi:MAG: hypothetical protein GY943_12490 [Chloroflexi bacterium]|nr:hypothetical protein [Chloroflexota bacterium]